ncbi:ComEA family DNA-binding protein [Streptomyces sp. NPDC005408]|uniref:ComEA family DNA-binding protein n=1 Tax=Streptomyces sp. NPDC005408 TaxID=3155341 RepID=UPI0033A8E90D
MALRTRSATSGPGRAPASDGRARDARDFGFASGSSGGPGRGLRLSARRSARRSARLRARRVAAGSTTALRRRADALFDGPPGGTGPVRTPRASPGLSPSVSLDAAVGRSRAEGGGVTAADVDIGTGARQRFGLAVRERLPLWVQLRCGLEPRALAALAVVLVVAAVFAAQHFWVGRPQTVRAPELVQQGASTPEPRPSPGPPPPPPPDPGPGGGRIVVVDVSGKVRRPGVHRLPAGSRVADALRAAGGVSAGTDLTGLNRARVLMDGEQVVVGVPVPPGLASSASGAGGSGAGGAGAQPAGPVSLNSATVEQLDTLPGVGPVLAQHIVDYRTQHGGFRSVNELREVNGIGARRFADLQTLVRP